jgi:hypothetical protein
MPGQDLRLYDIIAKVNERTDGKSCSADQLWVASRARRGIAKQCVRGSDPLQFARGLLSLLNCFSTVLRRTYDG